jgi:hypothetical protein
MGSKHVVHFFDWSDIKKGYVEPDAGGPDLIRKKIPYGVAVAIEPCTKVGPWLKKDKPWEGFINFFNIIKEKGKYRCWYETINLYKKSKAQIFKNGVLQDYPETLLCYAESDDAFTWRKPEMGIYRYGAFPENNIVSLLGHATCISLDDHDPQNRRYIGFHFDKAEEEDELGSSHVLYGMVSLDGYHWTRTEKKLIGGFRDTQNVVYYDTELKKYVGYVRGHIDGGRAISRSETDDFLTWPKPEILLSPGPEENAADDYYTNCLTSYPGEPALKFLFSAIYHHETDLTNVRMAVSRNGRSFNWVTREPIIDNGRGGDCDRGCIYAVPNLVQLPDGRLGLPYMWTNVTHNSDMNAASSESPEFVTGFSWATWEDGRLAGVEAVNYGEFFTKEYKFAGNGIQINARTAAAGKIKLELWENDQVIDGFSLADCIPCVGDSVWRDFRWKSKADLSELQGRSISIRFSLECAKVFGFRFV